MMENDFEQLVAVLPSSSTFTFGIVDITDILEKENNNLLSSFILESYKPLLTLQRWAWKLLSKDSYQWIHQPHYITLFHTLALFNKNLILYYDDIEDEMKASLLIPDTVDQIHGIFERIEQDTDNNDPFIGIVSLWFDNLSLFVHENPEFDTSPVISYINEYIARNYLMTEEFVFYLTQLQQPKLLKSIFTTKALFYIKTCSFSLSSYLTAKAQNFPFTAEEMMARIGIIFVKIIEIQSHIIDIWCEQLLTCITHLTGFVSSCYWWGGEKLTKMNKLFPSEEIMYSYINVLIRIISYKPFYSHITAQWSNDETSLIDFCLFSLKYILQTQDFIWFYRSKPYLPDTLLTIAEQSIHDKICLSAYVILSEILSDERLKDLKITDNVSLFFYDILEHAWQHPSKKYKQIPIYHLLRSFLTLSKVDAIQQKTADLNKLSILMEISDQYSITFDILWALSFNQDIQEQIRSNSSFMFKLSYLAKQSDNEQMRKMTHGILWNLGELIQDRKTSELNDDYIFDIMISYSHKDETICRQIYVELIKLGYRVWIDFDQMHENVMDAMAQAIEHSCTIIICMSEEYRKSNYFRAEAHYAFQRQLKIIPILLQEHYQPDGWLLFLIGQLLYVDFTKYKFSRAMELLMKELTAEDISEASFTSLRSKASTISRLCSIEASLHPSTPLILPKYIQDWTKTNVYDWLIEHNLNQMSQLLANCDGRGLLHLNNLIKNGETKQVLSLLQEELLRRTNESLSLVELSYLRSLLDQQKHVPKLTLIRWFTRRNTHREKKYSRSSCQLM